MEVGWLALGAAGGALSIWLNAMQAERMADRMTDYEVRSWAIFLLSAAIIYVGFALFNGASNRWLAIELVGLAIYGLVAWNGVVRFAPLVGVGWLLHTLWDQLLHPGGAPGYVPEWYPALCLGFDLFVGVALIYRFRRADLIPVDAEPAAPAG
jgi:hypothetical protein